MKPISPKGFVVADSQGNVKLGIFLTEFGDTVQVSDNLPAPVTVKGQVYIFSNLS